jgi:riboflavin kinase/FMN adenylyltransferase
VHDARNADSAAARDLDRLLERHAGPCVVTVGTFDGVHQGHRWLVRRAREVAAARDLRTVAMTFTPRPEQLFSPHTALPDLCSIEERSARLKRAGADDVVIVPFDARLAAMAAAVFADRLKCMLGMRVLCVGADFALGRNREGSPERLRALGYEVVTVGLLRQPDGSKISSSALRLRASR